MSGFFTIKETESKDRPGGKKFTCIACGAYRNCTSPRMEPYGEFRKKILIIGSGLEKVDDSAGVPFQSRYGKFLEKTLQSLGIDLFEDCLTMNSVHCCIKDEDEDLIAPTSYNIECCRKSTLQTIEQYKPHLIILLGNSALFSLIGHRWKKDLGTIDKWRGWAIPDQDFKSWICPTYDPKQVMNSKGDIMFTIWKLDLELALSKLQESIYLNAEPNIMTLEEKDLPVLSTIKNGNIAFDYETTGLKCHAAGHRIVSCSVAYDENNVYVFMMPETNKGRRPFLELLADPMVGKIAQNMKFEHTWSCVRLRQPVVNWVHDTMLMTHLFDNRPGVSGLKFQTYVQFGVVDYDSEVSPYLKSVEEKNANALNRIMELVAKPGGKELLLKYNAYDSIYEYRLSEIQNKIIEQ